MAPPVAPAVSPSAEVQPLAFVARTYASPDSAANDATTPPPQASPQPTVSTEPETPAPTDSHAPSPSEPAAPSESAEPTPSTPPEPTVSEPAEPTPSPSSGVTEPTPSPTDTAPPETAPPTDSGNSSPLPDLGADGVTYSLKVPVSMEGRYFLLTDHIDLSGYNGERGSDFGGKIYWTPIGVLAGIGSSGAPSGLPFQGSFDGGGNTVYNFSYAPNPTLIDPAAVDAAIPSMTGFGLFGYIGASGIVHDLNIRTAKAADGTGAVIPWKTNTLLGVTKDLSLGGRDFAIGVLAGASSGKLSNCTVSQVSIEYPFKPTLSAARTAVGGIVGLASGGTLENCVFLGSIANTVQDTTTTRINTNVNVSDVNTYTKQAVGGVAGYVSGTATLTQCASGAEIDVYNGGIVSKLGGVGGLLGYTSAQATLTRCFTTGVVRASHNAGGLAGCTAAKATVSSGYSTAALGVSQKSVSTVYLYKNSGGGDTSTTDNVILPLSVGEAIGGLFGRMSGSGSKLTDVYFAGGLLEPQFGAVAGWAESAPTLSNTAVDATQAPHDFYKNGAEPASGSKLRDLTGFASLTGWQATSDHTPEPIWSAPSAALTALSAAASLQWSAVDASNAHSDNGGLFSLYQLKDSALTASAFGATLTSPYKDSTGNTLGGEYLYTATVEGTIVPMRRCAVTAANQADNLANVIDSGTVITRFANRVNLAPGGYNGSRYLFTTFDAQNASIPAYDSAKVKPFCGILTGGTSSTVSNLTYSAGTSGIIDTGCDALLENFTLKNVTIGNVALSTSARYFGFAVGQVVRTDLTDVDINKLDYTYSGDDYNSAISIGLVGRQPLTNDRRLMVTNCDVTNLNISITGNTSLGLNIGGILGSVEGSGSGQSVTMTNCTMTGKIYTNLLTAPSNTPGAYPNVGGLLGLDNDSYGRIATFKNCTVNADLTGLRVGGLIGRARSAQMDQCVFSGNISTSDKYATSSHAIYASGGLIGANEHGSATININSCAVFGSISARYNAGGLIGYTKKPPAITNSYVSAVVSAAVSGGAAGGLVGMHDYTPTKDKPVATDPFTSNNSYFAGQVISQGTKGAIVGQAKTNNITFTNTLYDSTLFPSGSSTAGDLPEGITVPDCVARPEDSAKWTAVTTGTGAGKWSFTGTDRHYPQLLWLKAALPTLSNYSTLQLFDTTGVSSVHNFSLGNTFYTVLPSAITAVPALKGDNRGIPFTQEGDAVTDENGLVHTPYVTNADTDASDGLLKFTYPGMGQGGTDLTLPYVVGIKTFEEGSGTADAPYIIYDLSQLLVFRAFVNSSKNDNNVHYQISKRYPNPDTNLYESVTIDMVDDKGKPIDWRGTTSSLNGQLDGHGSTLTNFYTTGWTVKSTGAWNAGFLGGISPSANIYDLTITGPESGPTISNGAVPSGSGNSAGILSATAGGGTVTNVTVKGSIQANRNANVGGLIGSVTATNALNLKRCVTAVDISSAAAGGTDTGAGGLVGIMSASSAATATIEECAAYGSIQDWGAVGGIVGRVNNSGSFQLTIKNSYSLTGFTDTKHTSTVSCGGIVGSVDNLVYNDAGRLTIDSCYYAGENGISGSSGGRTVGGLVGGAKASINGLGNVLQNNGRDYIKLNIIASAYNHDSNKLSPANLYYKTGVDSEGKDVFGYVSRYGWPEVYYDGAGQVASDGYGTVYNGNESSFSMSASDSGRIGSAMESWNKAADGTTTLIWSFDEGLYPRFVKENVSLSPDLAFKHLAIHYTQSNSNTSYTNVFVRYKGDESTPTFMTTTCLSLLITENKRMAVAVDDKTSAAADVTITATIDGYTSSHVIKIIPSVQSRGYRDTSIYYANPNGMWPTRDGSKVWKVYTADALAGLATIFSTETEDQSGIPELNRTALAGGQVWLGRDIDLAQAYNGMSEYNTWHAIGDDKDTAFNITLDGKGYTLYNFAMNPFYRYHQGGNSYTYYNLDYGYPVSSSASRAFGLFGYIDGGTVQNLVLSASLSSAANVYTQAGVRVAQGVTAAGALAATMETGTLKNCLVSIPVYTMGDTPSASTSTDTEDWSNIPYLGAAENVPMGGLVGQVLGNVSIENCSYTGYVYADPKTSRPASGSTNPENAAAGPAGGLVGKVADKAALTITDSYAAGYVHGAQSGGLVGKNDGSVALSGVSYDQNAAGGAVEAVGTGAPLSGGAANQVPSEIGADWVAGTPQGLYPIQSSLASYSGTLAPRVRLSLTPHASSATAGALGYTADSTTLVFDSALQPAIASKPGEVVVTDNTSFAKANKDGLVQLELRQGDFARRVLVNMRCWYDEGKESGRYTISTAEELWELSQIVNGTIGDSTVSKVPHTHSITDGYDDFSGSTVTLAGNINLTELTDKVEGVDKQRLWDPIGRGNAFAGTFLGDGRSISGLLLSGIDGAGLFGAIKGTAEKPAIVQDLLLTNASLTLPAISGAVGGLLCARLMEHSTISHCGVSGKATASGSNAVLGGLVGENSGGAVIGCFSTAELSGARDGYVGGIAGSLSSVAAMVRHSYFTGYANTAGAALTGGIAGNNAGGTVSDCYVSAYLDGNTVYRAANGAVDCVYDGRHLGTIEGTDSDTDRLDGNSLEMSGDWTAKDPSGKYYPIPLYYTVESSTVIGTPLASASKLAAGIFNFSGASNAGYGRFNTVTVGAVVTGVSFLRSDNALLLSVSGNEARTVSESSGDVVLRLCLGVDEQPVFQRPVWLTIPSALAVTYRFNWDELIAKTATNVVGDPDRYGKLNAAYHTGTATTNTWSASGVTHIISTAADWESFVSFTKSNSTAGHIFTLSYDINFGDQTISTVTAPFHGTFNGNNHTMSRFNIEAPLFASVEQGAKVEMLGLNGGKVTISGRNTLNAGLIAGKNAGRIANVAAEDCRLTVTQNSPAAITSVGSLVGQNTGTLDSCYFYVTGSGGQIQMSVACPSGTADASLRMGGLVGYNSGTVKGCYNTLSMACSVNGVKSYNYSALVGLNDGGSILYSYWRYPYTFTDIADEYTAYRNSDGSSVSASYLFLGNSYTELGARWLSADSYGGTYYVSDGHFMLYSFRLAQYDLSGLFGDSNQQYLMLGLQFDSPGSGYLFSNAVCSWREYLLPNYADLPLTSSLAVHMPVLSNKLTFSLSHVYVIAKLSAPLTEMAAVDRDNISGSAVGGYRIKSLGENTTRVFLDVRLEAIGSDKVPWGVYRKDSTLPKTNP